MFTVCPGCSRQFRIYAEQIAAANGQVRCGFCDTQFNALERLHDEPIHSEEIQTETEFEEIEFDLNDEQEPGIEKDEEYVPAQEEQNIPTESSVTEHELETAIDEIGIKDDIQDQPSQSVEQLIEPETAPQPQPEPEANFDFPEPVNEPELILEQPAAGKSKLLAFCWFFFSFIALLLLVTQLAWFNRDQLLVKYPELTPYVQQICLHLDCELIRERDTRAISLINRDVRLHPRFKDTLLVNATMQNGLGVRQPFPRVQLTLFDTAGSVIGHRSFYPPDYLDDSIDVEQGMPVDSPVHFVLEVSGPTSGAVSFEFRFL